MDEDQKRFNELTVQWTPINDMQSYKINMLLRGVYFLKDHILESFFPISIMTEDEVADYEGRLYLKDLDENKKEKSLHISLNSPMKLNEKLYPPTDEES